MLSGITERIAEANENPDESSRLTGDGTPENLFVKEIEYKQKRQRLQSAHASSVPNPSFLKYNAAYKHKIIPVTATESEVNTITSRPGMTVIGSKESLGTATKVASKKKLKNSRARRKHGVEHRGHMLRVPEKRATYRHTGALADRHAGI